MNPLVSILIPAYNAEAWIAETIQSALGQTWPQKEIIVVDDGSTDRTLTMARQFVSQGVSVISQQNQGAAAARNRAFSASEGQYIQWLDADDLMDPDKISLQMAAMERCPDKQILLSASWAYFMFRPYKAVCSPTSLWCDLSPVEWLVRKLDQNAFMQTATWLVSRELSVAAGPWDTRLLGDDDGEYFCRVLLASHGVRFVPEARTFYRITGAQSLSCIAGQERKLKAHLLSMKLHVAYLTSLEKSERVRTACLRYLQRQLPSFYPEQPDLVKEIENLAAAVEGRLGPARLSWKYAWIQKLFGWRVAKRTQLEYNKYKLSLIRSWDKLCLRCSPKPKRLNLGQRRTQGVLGS